MFKFQRLASTLSCRAPRLRTTWTKQNCSWGSSAYINRIQFPQRANFATFVWDDPSMVNIFPVRFNIVSRFPVQNNSPKQALLDKSTFVHLAKFPKNYSENKEEAKKLGVLQYLQNSVNKECVTITFEELDITEDLNTHILHLKKKFFDKVGIFGTISPVKFSPALTKNFSQQNLPFSCLLLSGGDEEDLLGVFSTQLIFLLKTPAGCWEISLHSTAHRIKETTQQFAEMIQHLEVRLKPTPAIVAEGVPSQLPSTEKETAVSG